MEQPEAQIEALGCLLFSVGIGCCLPGAAFKRQRQSLVDWSITGMRMPLIRWERMLIASCNLRPLVLPPSGESYTLPPGQAHQVAGSNRGLAR